MDIGQTVSGVLTSGGRGTRNRPVNLYSPTSMIPKGLMPVMGIPLSELQIAQLKGIGVNQFYFLVKHLENKYDLSNRFQDGKGYEVNIEYSSSLEELLDFGSADALLRHLTKRKPEGHSVVLANDNIYEANWEEALKFHVDSNAFITILTLDMEPRELIGKYGLVRTNGGGKVIVVKEKPKDVATLLASLDLTDPAQLDELKVETNTGGYIVNNGWARQLAEHADWVRDAIRSAKEIREPYNMVEGLIAAAVERTIGRIEDVPVYAFKIDGWGDFGTNHDYLASVENALKLGFPSVTAIVRSKGYVHIEEKHVWIHPETYERMGGESLRVKIRSGEKQIGPNVFIGKGVEIEESAVVRFSDLEEDVIIGHNSTISHSIVFPNSLVGANVRIDRSILGLKANAAYSLTNGRPDHQRTTIEASFLGPEVYVPEGKHLKGAVVFPGVELSQSQYSGIISGKLQPTMEQLAQLQML